MSKKTYEVKVEFVGYEYYEVRANSPEEALKIWDTGTLVGTDGDGYEVVKVSEYFEDDDYEEDPNASDDY